MTNVTISRELLERIDESAICDGTDATISDDLFTELVAALATPVQCHTCNGARVVIDDHILPCPDCNDLGAKAAPVQGEASSYDLAYTDCEASAEENTLHVVSSLVAGKAFNSLCRMIGGRWPDAKIEQEAPEAYQFFVALFKAHSPIMPIGYTTPGMLRIAKELPLTGRIGAKCKPDDRYNVPLYTTPPQPAEAGELVEAVKSYLGAVSDKSTNRDVISQRRREMSAALAKLEGR